MSSDGVTVYQMHQSLEVLVEYLLNEGLAALLLPLR